jgi:WD40 repeat protein/serine/threonine protein kinase
MEKRYCIICGSELKSDDPNALFCAQCQPRVANAEPTPEPQPPKKTAPEPISDPELKSGQPLLGTYKVVSLLGKGGMGKVYRVHHTGWNMDLAVKQPLSKTFSKPGGIDRFIEEAETWVNLGLHPHITSCYYVRTIQDIPHIFVELVTGGSLEDWITHHQGKHNLYEGNKQEILSRILDIAIQFAWGLGYAHSRGLIHQDIKPLNVLMTNDGIVKVTDFGLARAAALALSDPGDQKGKSQPVADGIYSPPWASPEQVNRQGLTFQTDIWSWGVSVMEMFRGGFTWRFGHVADTILDLILEEGPSEGLPEIPEHVADLLHQCFRENPEDRPASMDLIADQLQEFYAQIFQQAYPREKPDAADLRADSLNNKALSLLDLGKTLEAVNCWRQALNEDPAHGEANLNNLDFRWRQAEITDDEMLAHLGQISGSLMDSPNYWKGMAQIHAERGDLEELQKCTDRAAQLDPSDTPDRENNVIALEKVLQGHKKQIFALQVHPNGKFLASSGSDENIRLWDIETGQCIKVFPNAGFTTSIAFSPSSEMMVSGSADRLVYVWNLKKKKPVRKMSGHTDVVTSVAYSADGERIISGSLDGTARVWNSSNGKSLLQYSEHNHWVLSIATPYHKELILTGGRDQTVRLWNTQSGETVSVYERPRSPRKAEYGSVSFNAGKVLWAGYDSMVLWDYGTGEILTKFISCQEKGAIEPYMKGALSQDGRIAVTVGQKSEKRFWDTKSGRCIATFTGAHSAESVCFGPGDSLFFGVSPDIEVWRLRLDPERKYFHFQLSIPASAAVSLEKQSLLDKELAKAKSHQEKNQPEEASQILRTLQAEPSFAHDEKILDQLAEIASRGQKVSLREAWIHSSYHLEKPEGIGGIKSLRFASGEPTLAAGHRDGTIHCFDIKSRTKQFELGRHIGAVASMTFLSPTSLLSLSINGDLILWDTSRQDGKIVKTGLDPNEGAHLSVLLADEGQYLIVQGLKGYSRIPIRLERVEHLPQRAFKPLVIRADLDLRMPAVMKDSFSGYPYQSTASPDSMLFTSSLGDSRFGPRAHPVFIWKITHAGIDLFRRFIGHKNPVLTMAFSRDQTRLVTADAGGEVCVWDIPNNTSRMSIKQPGSQFTSVEFSPDGNFIIAGDSKGKLFLWDQQGKSHFTTHSHRGAINAITFSEDGRYAASGGFDNVVHVWEFDWNTRFPEQADWDDGARPYLDVFLNRQKPLDIDQKIPFGSPSWDRHDLDRLLTQLGYCGYGWLRKEGVEKKLRQMT